MFFEKVGFANSLTNELVEKYTHTHTPCTPSKSYFIRHIVSHVSFPKFPNSIQIWALLALLFSLKRLSLNWQKTNIQLPNIKTEWMRKELLHTKTELWIVIHLTMVCLPFFGFLASLVCMYMLKWHIIYF